MTRLRMCIVCGIALLMAGVAPAASLTLRTGDVAIAQATATGEGDAPAVVGKLGDRRVTFENLPDGASLEITIDLKDGRQLRMVDTSSPTPPGKAEPAPLSDADKADIADLMIEAKKITKQFRFVSFTGNAEQAVAVVELVGDKTADVKEGQYTWSVEVWHFDRQAGVWARLPDRTRVLEHIQFDSAEALKKKRSAVFFVGASAGLRVEKGKNTVITLPAVPAAKRK